MIFGGIFLLTMVSLLIYMNYFINHRKFYSEVVVNILRTMFIVLFWVLYLPFFESFISIFKCDDNGHHYMD